MFSHCIYRDNAGTPRFHGGGLTADVDAERDGWATAVPITKNEMMSRESGNFHEMNSFFRVKTGSR